MYCEENYVGKRVMVMDLPGKRTRGNPKRRLLDNIRNDWSDRELSGEEGAHQHTWTPRKSGKVCGRRRYIECVYTIYPYCLCLRNKMYNNPITTGLIKKLVARPKMCAHSSHALPIPATVKQCIRGNDFAFNCHQC